MKEKKMKTRIKVETEDRTYYPNNDVILQPANKNMRTRSVSSINQSSCGEIVVRCYWHGRMQCRFVESEVTAASWMEIITPEVLKHIDPKRRLKKTTGYRLSNGLTVVKHPDGTYEAGCSDFTRKQLIKVCKAILKDEGEL